MGGEGGKKDDEQMHYINPTSLSSDWQFNNPNDLASSSSNPMIKDSCSSFSMVGSYCHPAPIIWDHHPTNLQNLGAFCDMNLENNATTSSSSLGFWKGHLLAPPRNLEMCWVPTDSVKRGGMFLPPAASGMPSHSLSQFPADLGFIEQAARLSSFSGGNFENVVNPFGNVQESSLSAYPCRPQVQAREGFVGNGLRSKSGEGSKEMPQPVDCGTNAGRQPEQGGSGNNLPGEAEFSGGGDENSNEGLASKKRRSDQDTENTQVKRSPQTPSEITKNTNEGQHNGENNPNSVIKSSGKDGKQVSHSSDTHKEEYIHVRARRGQATNSHSLAERVRREKISERMKFLQDLVPGCSKVTGKAVMLDEIINYVQSLQRQVEFLSMKLATVNPRMDCNLEGLLTKDILESRLGPSASLGFGVDMAMPNQSLMTIMQGGNSGIGRSSDAVRRTVNSHLLSSISGGFKDPASQVPTTWDDELHNIVHMGLNPNTPINNSQKLGSSPPNHLKTEL